MARFTARNFRSFCTVEHRRGGPDKNGKPVVTGTATYRCRVDNGKRLKRSATAGEVIFGTVFRIHRDADVDVMDRIAPGASPAEADYREILGCDGMDDIAGKRDYWYVEVKG